jgi:hypothetical protein
MTKLPARLYRCDEEDQKGAGRHRVAAVSLMHDIKDYF